MPCRRLLVLAALAAVSGCAPAPAPVTVAAPAPAPPRPATLAERLRREAWLARFWEELTSSQRRRVLARLRRGEPTTEDEAASRWDALGLPEREALVFGAGLPRQARNTVADESATAGP